MGIEMHVQGGNDRVVMGVLMLGQLVGQVTGVVVVDQGDGADRGGRLVAADLVLDQGVADQVADRLGTVDIAFVGNQVVEAFQQLLVDGDAEAGEVGHTRQASCGKVPSV
jgi:hypothetical protein